ncbi:unnamed protein product [Vicia faba]|uniref:Uncharacterized protein n=1 Tax=Vicia faba TaxID=3906 RepID=A0AAV0YT04_VICFA|nr:unnamed protein product [Vicia faba]
MYPQKGGETHEEEVPKEPVSTPLVVEHEALEVSINVPTKVEKEIHLEELDLIANPKGNVDNQDGTFKDFNPDNNLENLSIASLSSEGSFVDAMVDQLDGTDIVNHNNDFLNKA